MTFPVSFKNWAKGKGVMPEKIYIQIFDEADPLVDDERSTIESTDFGGIIPKWAT